MKGNGLFMLRTNNEFEKGDGHPIIEVCKYVDNKYQVMSLNALIFRSELNGKVMATSGTELWVSS